jgi:hypothetical protein
MTNSSGPAAPLGRESQIRSPSKRASLLKFSAFVVAAIGAAAALILVVVGPLIYQTNLSPLSPEAYPTGYPASKHIPKSETAAMPPLNGQAQPRYFTTTKEGLYDHELMVEVNGKVHTIVNQQAESCLEIIAQRDFDGDGVTDALVEDIQACGGNAVGNSFFFVSAGRDGSFVKSHLLGTAKFGSSWQEPTIEEWKGQLSVVVVETNEGMNQEEPEEVTNRFVLKDRRAVLVNESRRQPLETIKEIKSSDFDFERDDEVRFLRHDLNGDGKLDTIKCSFWARWGRILFEISVAGGNRKNFSEACKRIGVLSHRTGGFHDLVCDQDTLLRWSGREYAWVPSKAR